MAKSNYNYTPSNLSSLCNTQFFSNAAIEHIFQGQININGKAVGYHYERIEGTVGEIIPGSEIIINDLGVYKAQVKVKGLLKTGNKGFSTFYPKNLSPQQVINTINEAYQRRIYKGQNKYYGYSTNGLKIIMYLTKTNLIISAFPESSNKQQ